MIIQAGDLAVEIDTGGNEFGVVQRLEGDTWSDYLVDGEPVTWPVDLQQLEPGRYQIISSPRN